VFTQRLDHKVLAHIAFVPGGFLVLLDHTNRIWGVAATVCQGNMAHGVLARSLIVKTMGSSPIEAFRKAHQRPTFLWGRPKAIHVVTQLGAWPLQGFLMRGSNED
jgi:hypothetical protein